MDAVQLWWSIATTSVGLLINVVALFLVVRQVRLLRQQIRDASRATDRDHERRRQQATLEWCTSIMERSFDVRNLVAQAMVAPSVFDLFDQETESGRTNQALLARLFNLYDTAAIGVKAGVYDFDLTSNTIGYFVTTLELTFRSVIEQRRLDLAYPILWADFEWLANEIRARSGHAATQPAVSISWRTPTKTG